MKRGTAFLGSGVSVIGFVALFVAACGGEPAALAPGNNVAGTGVVPTAGAAPTTTAGTGGLPAGAAGTTTPPTGTTAPKPAGTGAVPAPTAGMPASGGAGAPAAVGGSGAAPSGGTSGMAGASGAPMGGTMAMPMPMPAGGGLIRGPEPTMESVKANGSYKVMSYTSGFKPGTKYLAGTIYYPTDAEPPLAGVIICPGFVSFQDSVAPWGPFFASNGIVTMTIDTNTPADDVDIRQGALLDALDSLKGEQTRMGSPLMGKLDMMRFGVMGWSMGGGGTWLNANTHPELKSAISLAGHILTQIGGAGQFGMVKVPTLMLAGSADTAILGLGMSQPVYQSIPESTPKILYEVSGATHFDISPSIGGGLFGMYGLSWQKVWLEGDMRYYKFLMLPKPANASDFKSNIK